MASIRWRLWTNPMTIGQAKPSNATFHVNRRTFVDASITVSGVVAEGSLLSGCGNSESVGDEVK
jgi:hypothetical protein